MRNAMLFCAAMLLLGCDTPVQSASGRGRQNMTTDSDPRIKIGMTRAAVTTAIGEPTKTPEWVKSDIPIFGLREGRRDSLADGDTIEIWDCTDISGMFSVSFLKIRKDGLACVLNIGGRGV